MWSDAFVELINGNMPSRKGEPYDRAIARVFHGGHVFVMLLHDVEQHTGYDNVQRYAMKLAEDCGEFAFSYKHRRTLDNRNGGDLYA